MAGIAYVNLVDDSPSSTSTDDAQDFLTTSFTCDNAESYDNSGLGSGSDVDLLITHETRAPSRSATLSINPRKRKYTGWTGLLQALHAKPQPPEPKAKESHAEPSQPRDAIGVREGIACPTKQPGEEWQLTYLIPHNTPRPKFWTYEIYRGRNNESIKVYYCKTLAECEDTARLFTSEPILGFDMEWKSRHRRPVIQDNVSLIQVAAEDKIALFHIAFIPGSAPADVLAPTLRKIIESPEQRKCGVAVNTADGNRLRNHLDLQPRGMFELNNFHHIVCAPADRNKGRSIGLSEFTHFYLGKPLEKGPVRTSDWTKALTPEQSRYAANDSYAGYRIFHAMNAKRLNMAHPPQIPAHTELQIPRTRVVPDQDKGMGPDKQYKRPKLSKRRKATQEPPQPPVPARSTTFRIPPELPSEMQSRQVDDSGTTAKAHSSLNQVEQPLILGGRPYTVFKMLWAKRRQVAIRIGKPDQSVLTDEDMRRFADTLPRTPSQLQVLPACAAFARTWNIDLLALVNSTGPA